MTMMVMMKSMTRNYESGRKQISSEAAEKTALKSIDPDYVWVVLRPKHCNVTMSGVVIDRNAPIKCK